MATAQRSSQARKQTKTRVEIGADRAREILGDLINRAGFGSERFVLTRHGKEVVAIVSIEDLNKLVAAEASGS